MGAPARFSRRAERVTRSIWERVFLNDGSGAFTESIGNDLANAADDMPVSAELAMALDGYGPGGGSKGGSEADADLTSVSQRRPNPPPAPPVMPVFPPRGPLPSLPGPGASL